VTDGDGATPTVVALRIRLELLGPHESDGRKSLVAFHGIELIDLHAAALEEFPRDGVGRREHNDGVVGPDGEVHEASPDR